MNWFDEDRGLDDSDMLSPLEIVDPAAASSDDASEPARPARELTASWSVKTDPGCDSDEALDHDGGDQDGDDQDERERDPDTGLSYDGTRRVYGLLCAMAHVDGRVAPAQRRELDEFQEYLGLSSFAARVLEDEACRSRSLRLGLRQVELDLLMAALIDMAAADGRISAKEERLLERVNERAGWSGDAIAEAAVRALERARSVQPVYAPDPAPAPAPAPVASDASGEDPFGLTINAPALGLEDSGEGDLVLPAAAAPALALRAEAASVLPPAPRASRSRSASASLAALAASDEAEARPAPKASRRARAAAPRARRRASAWR